jgi:hypothetical protein
VLAQNGLYFYNDPRAVQCAFCLLDIGIHDLPNEEDVLAIHRDSRTSCPYLAGLPVGNIPLDSENKQSTRKFCSANQITRSLTKREQYGTPEQKLATFKNWPKLQQSPQEMVLAGFRYTGLADEVKCTTCHRIFGRWSPIDKPLLRHAMEAPTCSSLIPFLNDENFQKRLDSYRKAKQQEAITQQNTTEERIEKITQNVGPLGCAICYDQEIQIILFPCRHVACALCVSQMKNCPMCQRDFKSYATIRLGTITARL